MPKLRLEIHHQGGNFKVYKFFLYIYINGHELYPNDPIFIVFIRVKTVVRIFLCVMGFFFL